MYRSLPLAAAQRATGMTMQMITKGTTTRDALRIADELASPRLTRGVSGCGW